MAEEIEIAEEETPLAAPEGAWALLNLILAILTTLGSILLLVFTIGKNKDENEDEAKAETDTPEQTEINKKKGWRIASIIPALAAIITFILTEDMSLPMQFTDKWTLLMAVIALAQIVIAMLSKKSKQDPDDDEPVAVEA